VGRKIEREAPKRDMWQGKCIPSYLEWKIGGLSVNENMSPRRFRARETMEESIGPFNRTGNLEVKENGPYSDALRVPVPGRRENYSCRIRGGIVFEEGLKYLSIRRREAKGDENISPEKKEMFA